MQTNTGEPFSILLCDVDNFKSFNDEGKHSGKNCVVLATRHNEPMTLVQLP